MKIKPRNYFGLNHEVANEKFTGGLTFINTFAMEITSSGRKGVAIYKVDKPDTSKGHKKYMGITSQYDGFQTQYYVMGFTQDQMEKDAEHFGIQCLECNEILISLDRHDYLTCDCKNSAMMDGGQEPYGRSGALSLDKIASVTVNLLTGKVTKQKKPKK